ncbi:MAG: hypothetical protein MJY82_06915, partial [Fibrobacter sp.]|nr:hypothetical protein [Fibrobacter sp.]
SAKENIGMERLRAAFKEQFENWKKKREAQAAKIKEVAESPWPGLDERTAFGLQTTNAWGECSGAACRPIAEPSIWQRSCKDER